MDENGSKKENDSTLPAASDIPLRDFMVSTAVHFLQNPKVISSPLSQKRAFLIRKGLTNEEIDAAIEKASAAPSIPYSSNHLLPPLMQDGNPILYKASIWSRINRYGSAVVIMGVLLYGLQRFYKMYIEPLLYGSVKRDSRLSQMEEQLLELSRSLSHLRKSVSSIEETLEEQKQQLQKYLSEKNLDLANAFNPALLIDLKSDISTVKSLLLNRRQFPEAPKFTPCIPSWQLIGIDRKNDRLTERETEDDKNAVNEALAPGHRCISPIGKDSESTLVNQDRTESEAKGVNVGVEDCQVVKCDEICNDKLKDSLFSPFAEKSNPDSFFSTFDSSVTHNPN